MGSTKKTLKQFTTLANGAMTGTTTLTSAVTAITGMDNIGFQFDWTGSPVGTFQILVSSNHNEDELQNTVTTGTWVPVMVTYYDTVTQDFITTPSVPTSVGSPIFVDVTQTAAPYIKCAYTNASGSGTLNVTVCGKNI